MIVSIQDTREEPVFLELMILDDGIKSLILKTSDSNTIKKKAVNRGMVTLRQDGALKVLNGTTTVEETLRITQK